MKKAFLVSFCPMTRIVIDVADKDNLTDDELDVLIETARNQILEDSDNYIIVDNLDEVKPDDECPYGTFGGED